MRPQAATNSTLIDQLQALLTTKFQPKNANHVDQLHAHLITNPIVTNIVTCTSLITHLHHAHHPLKSLSLFSLLLANSSPSPNPHTFSSVLSACAATALPSHGHQLHALAYKHGVHADLFVASALADMYAKCADMASSVQVFGQMPQRNLVSWNSLIVGYVRNRIYDKAIETFLELTAVEESAAVRPDQVTFSSVLSACANSGELSFGKRVHAHAVKAGVECLAYVKNSLIDMYGKCWCSEEASRLFESATTERDVVSWNAMMTGWVHAQRFEEACGCFRSMRRAGISTDVASFCTVIQALWSIAHWGHGATIHAQTVRLGFAMHRNIGSPLITMYTKCGSLDDASRVFEEVKEQLNVVSWTAMISAFQQHGHGDRAIETFDRMLAANIEPDYITFVCVLSACSHKGLIGQGFRYFDAMSKVYKIAPGSEHHACIVDMLGRAGRLEEAKAYIDKMLVKPDASVWGALLAACRNRGDLELGKEAAERLFEIEPENSGNYVLLSNMYAYHGRLEEASEVRRLMGCKGVRKETGYSWIDVKNETHTFAVHDRSHGRTKEIYEKLGKLEELVKEKGYVADTRFAVNDAVACKEQGLWYHSERLALAFGLIILPEGAPIRIKKNLRTCVDCHAVMKLISGIVQREIVIRDINRFHRFADGSCSCQDYW